MSLSGLTGTIKHESNMGYNDGTLNSLNEFGELFIFSPTELEQLNLYSDMLR